MKLIANKYDSKEIFRIIREWTELTQEQIGEQNGKKGRSWTKNIERGKSRYYFEDFLELCKKKRHNYYNRKEVNIFFFIAVIIYYIT